MRINIFEKTKLVIKLTFKKSLIAFDSIKY